MINRDDNTLHDIRNIFQNLISYISLFYQDLPEFKRSDVNKLTNYIICLLSFVELSLKLPDNKGTNDTYSVNQIIKIFTEIGNRKIYRKILLNGDFFCSKKQGLALILVLNELLASTLNVEDINVEIALDNHESVDSATLQILIYYNENNIKSFYKIPYTKTLDLINLIIYPEFNSNLIISEIFNSFQINMILNNISCIDGK
jgi:hypothetical protein